MYVVVALQINLDKFMKILDKVIDQMNYTIGSELENYKKVKVWIEF